MHSSMRLAISITGNKRPSVGGTGHESLDGHGGVDSARDEGSELGTNTGDSAGGSQQSLDFSLYEIS